MIRFERYTPEREDEWNSFVSESLNGTFLFHRNYMDYHADRFEDCSLMVMRRGKLISLIAANVDNGVFHSHGGLSYGGFIVDRKMGASRMMEMFDGFLEYLQAGEFSEVIYKPVPILFHGSPCEFDLYALFRNDFDLSRREISTLINIPNARFKQNRKSGYNFAVKNNVKLIETDDYDTFIGIANERLESKYAVRAVHTADELRLLKTAFPENIRLFGAFREGRMLGGSLLYLINRTVHAQYLYCNDEGREFRGLDFMIVSLLRENYSSYDWFDFGKSTEDGGHYLNQALIKTKEEFGGTSICYDTYSASI